MIVVIEYKIDSTGTKEPTIPIKVNSLPEAHRVTQKLYEEQIRDCQIIYGENWKIKQSENFGFLITDSAAELKKFGFVENKTFREALNILEKK